MPRRDGIAGDAQTLTPYRGGFRESGAAIATQRRRSTIRPHDRTRSSRSSGTFARSIGRSASPAVLTRRTREREGPDLTRKTDQERVQPTASDSKGGRVTVKRD